MALSKVVHSNLSGPARIGIFSAMAIGINLPFLAIPNVETFSLAIFLAGLFLGIVEGIWVAFIAGMIFIIFNPNGPQIILAVGLAQLAGFTFFSIGGSLSRKLLLTSSMKPATVSIVMGSLGLILTLIYDLLTNLVFAFLFGQFWAVLIGGLSFSLIHIISNTIIFGFFALLVRKVWKRIEYIMPRL